MIRRALALAISLPLLAAEVARAQLSPGPLASAHAELDRATQCFQCHARGGAMDLRCLACHTEIDAMIRAKRGFHARSGRTECANCHPDHAGREFEMIRWESGSAKSFDHARAGYVLTGAHAKLECSACHQPKFQRSPVASRIRRKDRTRSWLGLESNCLSCHEDAHRGQLGADCLRCHDTNAWKPAKGFDHSKTAYALTGRHANVACMDCHAAPSRSLSRPAGAEAVPRWKPLPHADCASCHRDPHAGRFRGACASCHTTDDFHRVKESGFDHGQTRYPLRGKHAAVPCASCHDPKRAWGAKPAFASCVSCHRDAHAGQATLAGRPADCAACHDERGFETSLYTAEQHRASAYPLEGAHARSQCALCHAKAADGAEAARLGSARVRMRPAHDACITCHRDPHDGRFPAARSAARQDACLACHSMTAFRPSQVSLAAHARYAYALTGAHRAVPCQACHAELSAAPSRGSLKASAPGRALRFEDSRRRCAECHPGPHGEQFAARADGGACESCHDDSAWLPASGFDHARDAAYRLDGAHVKVACSGCHPSVRGADGKVRVIYRPISHACETCHRTTPPKGDGAWLPESRRGAAASAKLFATHEVTHVQRTF